jgi:DNA polymerase-3 subunit epsilon
MDHRQIVLDTETTGIDPKQGHRIIEIGCVELINRRLTGNNFHVYVNPDRPIEEEAIDVHGITSEFLRDKPRYHQIAQEFFDYIKGSELVIHNAAFDVGFMDHEFAMLNTRYPKTAEYCKILDTLKMARDLHPGQMHGALLDSEILADVYLTMTGGQVNINYGTDGSKKGKEGEIIRLSPDRAPLSIIMASAAELAEHESRLDVVGDSCLWRL